MGPDTGRSERHSSDGPTRDRRRGGVPPEVVSDILGHATVAFTMDTCAHAVPSMQADAVDLVANLVWGS